MPSAQCRRHSDAVARATVPREEHWMNDSRSQPGAPVRLADDLWLLDTLYQGEPGVVASYLLTGGHGLGLVDVGSGATVEQLLAGVRATGHDPAAIEHLVLTHVHLDHAGATGRLLEVLPRARAYVHRIGAPHLSDPSRLVASATRIYGERMQTLWGRIVPVPPERLVALDEGAEVQVGERTLRADYTPGHAIHHLVFFDAAHGALFAGDLAGVRLQGVAHVRPPTPPPDLCLEDWSASLERVVALVPAVLYLAHFGPVAPVEAHVAELRARLERWGQAMLAGMRAGKDDAALAADLAAITRAELLRAAAGAEAEALRRYELAANYLMSAQGYMRYYRKHHPELLA
jgi:glyoxylase-like metal-dependent hydrolase (beta-lactamase superfamily II)